MVRFATLALAYLAALSLSLGLAVRPAPAASITSISSSNSLVPLERVLKDLRQHYSLSGEQLDAKLIRQSPNIVLYEVQWLTAEGRKIVFIVNARDGSIVATRGLGN